MTDQDTVFTTEEIHLEERRMARHRKRMHVFVAAFHFTLAAIAVANLALFYTLGDEVWPHWVEAMQYLPGSAVLHWRLVHVMFAVWVVFGLTVGVRAWVTRHPPDDKEWTLTALVRLTRRGGLYEERDE